MTEFGLQPLEPTEMIPGDAQSRLDAVMAGNAVQQVRTAYATALQVQKPRALAEVQRRLLEEARLGGEEFYYGWGAGSEKIEGPSVKLAMALARCWGNCAVDLLPVQDLPDSWIFTASFVDLETGFTLQRQFRQSKAWKVHGRHDDERKQDIRFQIGQSKAVRNVVLNALPASLISRAMAEAKTGVRAKIEAFIKQKGLPAAVDLLVGALGKCGVSEQRILARCLVADRKAITVDHMVTLRGDLYAIESGQERPDVLFPVPTVEGQVSVNGNRAQEIAAKLAPSAEAATSHDGPAEPVPAATTDEKPPAKVKGITKGQLKRLQDLAKQVGLTTQEFDGRLAGFGVEKAEQLAETQADELVRQLTQEVGAKAPARQPGEDG